MGSFLTQNKVRPGIYVNFESASNSLLTVSDRGTVALPLEMDFFVDDEIIEVNGYTDFFKEFGVSLNSVSLIPVRETLKNAETVFIYRLNSGNCAFFEQGAFKVTSKFSGEYGNNIKVFVFKNDNGFDVTTYVCDEIFETQSVLNGERPKDNNILKFEGTLTDEQAGFIYLDGGSLGETSEVKYNEFFEKIAVYDFNTFAILSDDVKIKDLAYKFCNRMRENDFKKIQCVLSNYDSADYEGAINVTNGVILSDGTEISSNLATSYVAGAVAGCNINESLTYSKYLGAVDAFPRFTNSEIIKRLSAGEFIFSHKRSEVVIEQDINSFTDFSPTKSSVFSKNRVIRVLDNIAHDIKVVFEDFYLGKVSNNEHGRSLFAGECIRYLRNLESLACIENFDALEDIKVLASEDYDSIVVSLNIKPIDSIEKLYMTVVLG